MTIDGARRTNGGNRFAQSILKQAEFIHSTLDVRRSLVLIPSRPVVFLAGGACKREGGFPLIGPQDFLDLTATNDDIFAVAEIGHQLYSTLCKLYRQLCLYFQFRSPLRIYEFHFQCPDGFVFE